MIDFDCVFLFRSADAQHQRDSNALKHKVKETEPAFSSTDETVTMSPPLLPLHWYSESTLPMMTEETFWLQRAVLKDKLIAQYQKKLLKEAQERAKAAEAAAQEPLDGNPEDNQMSVLNSCNGSFDLFSFFLDCHLLKRVNQSFFFIP